MALHTIFFLDLDNTLLNNDRLKNSIKKSLVKVLGETEANHFWKHNDEFRARKHFANFPQIIEDYCKEKHSDTCNMKLGSIFSNINFKGALFPNVLKVIHHLKTLGKVYLFTEGDSIYQKHKYVRSGIKDSVDKVFCFKYKMEHLNEVISFAKNNGEKTSQSNERLRTKAQSLSSHRKELHSNPRDKARGLPAGNKNSDCFIVFVDDKAKILLEVKEKYPDIFTIEVCQGHYAKKDHVKHKELDMKVDSISRLLDLSSTRLDSYRNNEEKTSEEIFSGTLIN